MVLPNLTCVFRIKKSMEQKMERYNLSYSKYSNWPSCDSTDWMFRYWGENYSRLLAIKVHTHLTHDHDEHVILAGILGP